MIGPVFAQQRGEGMNILRGAVQGEHAGRGRAAERRLDPETLLGLCKKGVITGRKSGAHLPYCARALLRRDAVEHDASRIALPRTP